MLAKLGDRKKEIGHSLKRGHLGKIIASQLQQKDAIKSVESIFVLSNIAFAFAFLLHLSLSC
jgi:hypothetical protein